MYLVSSYNGENGMYISHEDGLEKVDIWERWGLIPKDTRLSVAPPEPRYDYLDIPGATSSLDLSTITSQYPTYQNRTGTWTFRFIRHPNLGNKTWHEIRSEIMNYIHGRVCVVELKEDIDYVSSAYINEQNDEGEPQTLYYKYRGRLTLNSWESSDHETEVMITYQLEPYKLWALSSENINTNKFMYQSINASSESATWDKTSFVVNLNDSEYHTMLDEMPIFPIIYYDVTAEDKQQAITALSQLRMEFVNEMLGLAYSRPIYLSVNEIPEAVVTNSSYIDQTFLKSNNISFTFKYDNPSSSAVALYKPKVSLLFTSGRL